MAAVLLACLSGALFCYSLPPYNVAALGWIFFVPLLIAAQNRRPLEIVGLGILAGLTSAGLYAGWSSDTGRLFWAYMPFLLVMFLFGFVATLAVRVRQKCAGLPWIAFVAALGVTAEWLTTFAPLPIPISLSQYRVLPFIQIAAVTGIWGVSFLLWWVNAALADAALNKQISPRSAIVTVLLLGLSLGAGALARPRLAPSHSELKVAAIQDLSEAEVGSLGPVLPATFNIDREAMTRQAAQSGAQLIVWSEECLGSDFTPNSPRDTTNALARQTHASLVVGYSDDARPHPFNCAAFVDPHGRTLAVSHKIHLYLGERDMVQPGQGAQAFSTPLGKVGMEICFDSAYTDTTRHLVHSGAQIIAMPNYDPPTPRGVLHELHSAMLPFRAVENHVPFVRADSNGVSQIVAADGRLVGQSPLYRPDVLIGTVALGDGQGTLFTRLGDWFAWLCVAASFLVWVILARRPDRS